MAPKNTQRVAEMENDGIIPKLKATGIFEVICSEIGMDDSSEEEGKPEGESTRVYLTCKGDHSLLQQGMNRGRVRNKLTKLRRAFGKVDDRQKCVLFEKMYKFKLNDGDTVPENAMVLKIDRPSRLSQDSTGFEIQYCPPRKDCSEDQSDDTQSNADHSVLDIFTKSSYMKKLVPFKN